MVDMVVVDVEEVVYMVKQGIGALLAREIPRYRIFGGDSILTC